MLAAVGNSARMLYGELLDSVRGAGASVGLLVDTAQRLVSGRVRIRPVLDQMYAGGVLTIPIVVLVSLFMGMVLALQTGLELLKFGQQDLVGVIVSVAMCREIGPIITGIILSAAVGSAMAAELGTMSVSDELTALDVMTVDKTRFLVLPRVLALAVMCPILTLFADLIGIVGAGIVGVNRLNVGLQLFITTTVEALRGTALFSLPKDLYVWL